MEIQQRIAQQRIQHIIDSYLLTGNDADSFDTYLSELRGQYSAGLIELALVETLVKSWLTLPMQKGIPFLSTAHELLKQWQQQATDETQQPLSTALTSSQFSQITGLDPQMAFAALLQPTAVPTQSSID